MKIMIPDDSYPERYWLNYDHDKNLSHLEFSLAKKLEVVASPMAFSIKDKVSLANLRKFDFLYSDGPDLVSENVARILRNNCPDEVQFFSARVKVNGEILTDYAVLNLLKSEEAFDLEGCVYVPLIKSMPDGPRKFKNIALQDKLSNAQIFRASEDRGSIIVSEKLAQIFTSATVKGVRFVSKLEGV
ncbi:imm11 family protein [Pseudomonas alabamensis]|jgi:hypothetical protein|uniref:imm11 family protein n=1 Tax=Pseudomonas alabamensis TaxID=3064349 RepID=UPI00119FB68B